MMALVALDATGEKEMTFDPSVSDFTQAAQRAAAAIMNMILLLIRLR